MGYHHLHFDAAPSSQVRSDDVLFAHVTRDTLTVVGIFNHTVFEATQTNTFPSHAPLTREHPTCRVTETDASRRDQARAVATSRVKSRPSRGNEGRTDHPEFRSDNLVLTRT